MTTRSALWLLAAALSMAACIREERSTLPSTWNEPRTDMVFALIEPGRFVMGSPLDEPGRELQEVQHEVTLTRPFYLGRYEVTQAEWAEVMGDNPSRYQECGPDCPVETVNYMRIQEFLSELGAASGERFRLPTEAEWEYACRAGRRTAFGRGDAISSELANFDGRDPHPGAEAGPYRAAPTPVGSFPPNDWGIYDMNGNVWEWCEDEYCPYRDAPAVDPLGSCGGTLRVIRGGSWYYGPDSARCALRYTHRPVDDGPSLGFRVVREVPNAGVADAG